MAKQNESTQEFKFLPGMTFGTIAAERDSLLSDCFFPTAFYQRVRDINDVGSGLIGRSGSGKTAILEQLKMDHLRAVTIHPEELAFRYLGESDLIKALRQSGVNLDYFYKLLWRHVFVVEILKHRFPDDAQQTGLIGQLIERIRKGVRPDQARVKAIKYLDEWGATVLQAPHERIEHIHGKLEESLRMKLGVSGSWWEVFGLNASIEKEVNRQTETEKRIRTAQKIVSLIQVQDLNAVKDYIGSEIIDDPQSPCFVLIDDLDKFWVEEPVLYELIRAMLLEVDAWANVPNVKIIYALRDNVLHKLESNFQSRSYQREKLADQQVHLQWSRKELTDLVDKRLAWLAGKPGGAGAPRIASLLPKRTNRRPSGLDYILERTLNRPRDVIDFLNRASQLATGRNRFSWSVIERAEQSYSDSRLVALFDEWHENYDGLDLVAAKLLNGRKPRFTKSDWDEDVLLDLFTEVGVAEKLWLADHYNTFIEMYQEDRTKALRHFTNLFISVMYEVGLIGVKTSPGGRDFYAHAELPILRSEQIDEDTEVIVCPMFYAAFQVQRR